MRSSKSLLLAVVVIAGFLLLQGCALPPERNTEHAQTEELLAYFHRLASSPLDVQRKEHLEALSANDRTSDESSRIRVAMTFMLPGVPWRDDARVIQLLSTSDAGAVDRVSSRRDLLVLLEKMVQVRREDARKCDQKQEQLRDERRKVEQKLDASRDECKRADALQQKLDELRDIDRDLRDKRPAKRTRP
jgi:hypothetical protein